MRFFRGSSAVFCVCLLLAGIASTPAVRATQPGDAMHAPLDEILDIYVRDGLVYYQALRLERGKLDRYVETLASTSLDGWHAERRTAFWLNAYNAMVLRTVIDHYPIRGKAPQYPAASIRQIPGAFETRTHRVAGRLLTLDAIEKEALAVGGDARVVLALGRGARGGGRLRSEAFTPERLAEQLEAVAAEALTRREIVRIIAEDNTVSLSPLFSWREAAFVASYAAKARAEYAQRSPVERAALALIEPALVQTERDFMERNQFRMAFHDFDWRLNDLTGGRRD